MVHIQREIQTKKCQNDHILASRGLLQGKRVISGCILAGKALPQDGPNQPLPTPFPPSLRVGNVRGDATPVDFPKGVSGLCLAQALLGRWRHSIAPRNWVYVGWDSAVTVDQASQLPNLCII